MSDKQHARQERRWARQYEHMVGLRGDWIPLIMVGLGVFLYWKGTKA